MTDRPSGKACIRRKLMTLLLAGNALLLLVVSSSFIVYELARYRGERSRELATLGEMMGRELAAPLVSGDRRHARQALLALAQLPHLLAAELVAPDGSVLARYQKAAAGRFGLACWTQQVSRPILNGGRQLATLKLVSQEDLFSVFAFPGTLLLLTVFGLLGLAGLLSSRFQRLICDPISQLSRKMEIVSRSQDYQVRVQGWDDDELGLLFGCFNEMLAEIAVRDERLALHSEELQMEVTERTRELSEVNRQLEVSLKEVKRTMQDAQAANRAKSDFLAQMSHEIRTPMYGVLGMTELLQNTDLSKEQTRFVETVRRSGEALLGIINNILDFSKIEAGRMELEVIPFDLHELVTDTVEMFSEEAGKKGLALRHEIGADVPRSFLGDPGRLRQVMVNLLANALKFTPRGSVRLVAFMERPPDLVRISICDTGIGIAPDARSRIFRQFAQGDESMTRRYGGTGLGLAIARQLTELMGGELGVTSEPGRGSTFSFTVRLEPAAAGEWAHPEHSCKALRGKRALVVSGRPAGADPLIDQLTAWGMDVESVADATATLCRLAAAPFDLALLDERLAGAEGGELVATIGSLPAGRSVQLLLLCEGEPAPREDGGKPLFLNRSLHPHRIYARLVAALGMEPSSSEEECSDPLRRPLHVLLVEDNPVNQEVGRGMLESLACTVDLAENGLCAIEAVQRSDYDLVFMDCQMPELDGLEATRRIRSWEAGRAGAPASGQPFAKRRVPIIALTAYAMKGDRIACLESGADDYLSKPFTRDGLSRVMSRQLQPRIAVAPRAAETARGATAADPQQLPEEIGHDNMSGALQMIRTLPGNRGIEILRKVVDLYLTSTPTLLQTLREAESGGDAEKLKAAAHSFKSSSANLGALKLAGVCKQLEALGRQGSTEGAGPLLMQVEEEYRTVRDALQGGPVC